MSISDFHHANQIGGVDYRPDFRSLIQFGNDKQKIADFMQNHRDATDIIRPLKRIVLLEDFVGWGTQVIKPLQFAASLPGNIPILLVPLIICPDGVNTSKNEIAKHAHLSYGPIVELEKDLFINNDTSKFLGPLEKGIKDIVESTYHLVIGNNASAPRPYSKFGFKEMGATVVMYSNTPANTLPIIQHESNTWHALFPRSARIR
jgi:hypothetical protein